MPAFPNQSKVASQVVVQIGIAISLETAYQDFGLRIEWTDANPDAEFTREAFVEWLNKEEEEIVPEEYEEFRDRYHGDLDHMDVGYSIYSHHNY